jgi:hypothetical protein
MLGGALSIPISFLIALAAWFMGLASAAIAAWFTGPASVTIFGEYTRRLWFRTVRREFIDEQESLLKTANDTATRLLEENERLQHEVARLQQMHREQGGPLQQS